jgi:hypothetical protein
MAEITETKAHLSRARAYVLANRGNDRNPSAAITASDISEEVDFSA